MSDLRYYVWLLDTQGKLEDSYDQVDLNTKKGVTINEFLSWLSDYKDHFNYDHDIFEFIPVEGGENFYLKGKDLSPATYREFSTKRLELYLSQGTV